MGEVMLGRGDAEKAMEYMNAAVEHFPETWQAYCDRGDCLKKLGRYEDALADYEKCFTMQEPPRITDGLYSMAQLHERLGDLDAAIRDRERILQCLKEEHQTVSGEETEEQRREIRRLKREKSERKNF